MAEWGENEELDEAESEGDPGFLGGGGPAETIAGGSDELDEHGDNLSRGEEEL